MTKDTKCVKQSNSMLQMLSSSFIDNNQEIAILQPVWINPVCYKNRYGVLCRLGNDTK